MVPGFKCASQGFNPFQVVRVPGGTSWSTLVVFHVAVQASQHHFLGRLSFVQCLLLAPWSPMGRPCMFELGSGRSIRGGVVGASRTRGAGAAGRPALTGGAAAGGRAGVVPAAL